MHLVFVAVSDASSHTIVLVETSWYHEIPCISYLLASGLVF